MKRDPSRPPQPKTTPARHRFEHQSPTQIHDPEADMMLLARWANRAMKNQTRFWGVIVGCTVALLAVVLLVRLLNSGSTRAQEVWTQLETANSAAERLKVADDYPKAPASVWARLEAATEYYNEGFDALPNSRDLALPMLKKALDNFDEVARDAPKDSPQARTAALGKARTLEARNEIDKAIEQYQLVEKAWPGTAEATRAKHLAEELKKPEAQAFYKELYAFSPTKVTLPPMGSQSLDMPLLPSPGSGLSGQGPSGSILPSPSFLPPPPPTPVGKKETPAGSGDPRPTGAKGADVSKTPKPATRAQPAPALPENPFDRSGKSSKAQGASSPMPEAAPSKPAPSAPVEKSKS
jgi:tetratricopeptide (TPR) repeat protein